MKNSVQIHQSLRPIKLTILISEEEEDSTFIKAIEYNTALWGGILNPIVFIETDPSKIYNIFRASHSDFLVNLSKKPNPIKSNELPFYRQLGSNGHNSLFQIDNNGKTKFSTGIDIRPSLLHYGAKWASRLATLEIENIPKFIYPNIIETEWDQYSLVSYGRYPNYFSIDYASLYKRCMITKDSSIKINDIDLYNPFQVESPVTFTSYGIYQYKKQNWSDPTTHMLFIGDPNNKNDLIEFWNLRAFGSTVVFIPHFCISIFSTIIIDLYKNAVYMVSDNTVYPVVIQKSSTISSDKFNSSIAEIRRLLPKETEIHASVQIQNMEISTHPWINERHGPPTLEASVVYANDQYEKVEINDNLIEFSHIAHPFQEFIPKQQSASWAISISALKRFEDDYWINLPYSKSLENSLHDGLPPVEKFYLSQRENIVIIHKNDYINHFSYFEIPTTIDVYRSYLKDLGITLTDFSEKGKYANGIEKSLGGAFGGAVLLRNPGIRKVLLRLSKNGNIYLTKNEIFKTIGEEIKKINIQQKTSNLTPDILFNNLLNRQILRPGLEFKCRECYHNSWYHIGDFDESFTCPYCFTKQQVGSLDRNDWKYRSSGLFATKDVGYGSMSVICASLFFKTIYFSDEVYPIFSFEGKYQDQNTFEVDLAAVHKNRNDRTEIVICECKTSHFEIGDLEKLEKITSISKDIVPCIATFESEINELEKEWCKKMYSLGNSVIILTKEELEYSGVDEGKDRPRFYSSGDFHSLAEQMSSTKLAL